MSVAALFTRLHTFTSDPLACLTFGVALPAGNFVPGIVIGGTAGRLMGELLTQARLRDCDVITLCLVRLLCLLCLLCSLCFVRLLHLLRLLCLRALLAALTMPSNQANLDGGWPPGAFALVGAAAVLSSMTRMTLTLAAILTEVAKDVKLLPMIMLALTVTLPRYAPCHTYICSLLTSLAMLPCYLPCHAHLSRPLTLFAILITPAAPTAPRRTHHAHRARHTRHTRHTWPTWPTWPVCHACHACSLSLLLQFRRSLGSSAG